MKESLPIYTSVTLSGAYATATNAFKVDLSSSSWTNANFQVSLTSSTPSANPSATITVNWAFSDTDLGSAGAAALSLQNTKQTWKIKTPSTAGAMMQFDSKIFEVAGDYLYVWLDQEAITPSNSSVIITAIVVQSGAAATAGSGGSGTTTVVTGSTAVLSNVASSASTGVLKAANSSRKGLYVFNDATVAVYIAFAATAALTAFTVKVLAGGYYEMPQPIYTGAISAIWDTSPSGSARVTELS